MKKAGSSSSATPLSQKQARYKQELMEFDIAKKSPHLYQVQLRACAKDLYEDYREQGFSHYAIRYLLRIFFNSLSVPHMLPPKPEAMTQKRYSRYQNVLNEMGEFYMDGARFAPDLDAYQDGQRSEGSDSEKEELKLQPGASYRNVYMLTRGIGYKHSKFDQFTRTQHRSYSLGSLYPNYSIAAAKRAIAKYNKTHFGPDALNLVDYFKGNYDRNREFLETVKQAAAEIAAEFKHLWHDKYTLSINYLRKEKDASSEAYIDGQPTPNKEILPIHLLHDIYTNDMAFFLKLLDQKQRQELREDIKNFAPPVGAKDSMLSLLNRNGVLALRNPEAVKQLIDLLDGLDFQGHSIGKKSIHFTDNPYTSTGFTHQAAFDYSIENKTYGIYHLQEFFPNYNDELIPQHPFIGKFYAFLLTEDEYESSVQNSAINVVAQDEQKVLSIHPTIIDENEMTFIGGCVFKNRPFVKVATYPDLSLAWDEWMEKEYGLNETQYQALKETLRKEILPPVYSAPNRSFIPMFADH